MPCSQKSHPFLTLEATLKTRSVVLSVLTLVVGVTVCFAAANPNLGTWKLNEAKSKLNPGLPKNLTAVIQAVGDNIKVTLDGVDGQGKPTHSEWTGKFDGKDYPVTGDPTSDMRSYKTIDDHTLEFAAKKSGQVTISGKAVVSPDGKTRTVTVNGTDATGKQVTATSVYDKQ
jgi:hypothetical protein